MNPILRHDSGCSLVVDLQMECNPPVTIGGVCEMGLSYVSGKNLILGRLQWYVVTTGSWDA